MCFIFSYLGDFLHHAWICFLMSALIACLTVAILIGSLLWRNSGVSSIGLDPYTTASLASVSAHSLPIDFMWPATHVKEISVLILASGLHLGQSSCCHC